MTALEKATELRNKYCKMFGLDHVDGCRAAEICVEEIIQDRKEYELPHKWLDTILSILKQPLI